MKEVFECLLFSAGMQMKTEGVIYPRPQNSANPKAMQCTPQGPSSMLPSVLLLLLSLLLVLFFGVVLPKEIVVIFSVYMNGPKTSFLGSIKLRTKGMVPKKWLLITEPKVMIPKQRCPSSKAMQRSSSLRRALRFEVTGPRCNYQPSAP